MTKRSWFGSALVIGLVIATFTGGAAVAALVIQNGNIATGAVDSRTIKDDGIFARDIHSGAINSSKVANGSLGYGDLAASTLAFLQTRGVRPGMTVRGVIGGDFDIPTGTSCTDNCDWGAYASLQFPAQNLLGDDDVLVDVTGWIDGGGQTQPTVHASEAASAAAISQRSERGRIGAANPPRER